MRKTYLPADMKRIINKKKLHPNNTLNSNPGYANERKI